MSQREQYEHPIYKPGMRIYVDPSIRDIHPLHKAAGEVVSVTKGPDYTKLLTPDELKTMDEFEPESGVPILFDGEIYYIKEQYVREVTADE